MIERYTVDTSRLIDTDFRWTRKMNEIPDQPLIEPFIGIRIAASVLSVLGAQDGATDRTSNQDNKVTTSGWVVCGSRGDLLLRLVTEQLITGTSYLTNQSSEYASVSTD